MRLNHLIPSMYQRRLLLLAGGMLACVALPTAQMASLTLGKGERSLADAERRLISETWIESSRGRIIDRKGRPLAIDRPSLDVSVSYDVISGRWVDQMATRAARRAKLGTGAPVSQEDIAAPRPAFERHLADMWSLFAETAGISEAEVKQRRSDVIEQVQFLATTVTEKQRTREQDRREKIGNNEPVITADVKVTIVEQQQSHVLLRGLSDQVGMQFERLKGLTADIGDRPIPLMPGLTVQDSSRREYPQDVMSVPVDTSVFPPPLRGGVREIVVPGVGMHSIGRLRARLYKEDLDRRPRIDPSTGKLDRGYYRPGDAVGHGGVEQAKEDTLRGLRGLKVKHLDTGEEEIVAREPGGDVSLTLDAALQARIQALFDPSLGLTVVQPWHKTKRVEEEPKPPGAPQELPVGTALNGAVVVIDVASGDVLALVSMPSYSHEQIDKMPETIAGDTYNQAFLNRAIAKVYPPGSIVKPLVLCEAIREGVYATDQHVACTGHFYPDQPKMYRCWIYKQTNGLMTHTASLGHDLDGSDGIRCSCNIFFFEMGRRLGPQGIFDTYTTHGVGRDGGAFNLFGLPPLPADPKDRVTEQKRRGLLFEAEGEVRDVAKSSTHEAVLMAIGQGPVTWTPLHAANAYATLARRGVRVLPRIFADAVQSRTDLKIPSAAIDQSLKGLYGSANERFGTTHTITYTLSDGSTTTEDVFTAPGVTVWAKSGTADTNPFAANLPGGPEGEDGKEMYDSDHSWCVCLVGVGGEPKYAIASVVDYGGSGGRVAGPVANQVVYALIGEGYLPDLRGGKSHSTRSIELPEPVRNVAVPTEGH